MISHIKRDCYDLSKNNKFMISLGMLIWILCGIVDDPSIFHFTSTEQFWAITVSSIINLILNFLIFYQINLNNYGHHFLLVKKIFSLHDDYKIKKGKHTKWILIRRALAFPVIISIAIWLTYVCSIFMSKQFLIELCLIIMDIIIIIALYILLCKDNTASTVVHTKGNIIFNKNTKKPDLFRIDKASKSSSKKNKNTDK